MNARWQMIFGIALVLAIILAVIVMVTVSLNGEDATPVATPTPSASSQAGATPTPTATPTPSESIQVTSVTIAYYDDPRVTIGGSPTPVTAKVYPVDVEAEVNWSVKEGGEDIISISIDDDGTCEVEGIGNGSAVLVAECGGVSAECTVYSG